MVVQGLFVSVHAQILDDQVDLLNELGFLNELKQPLRIDRIITLFDV